MMSEQDKESWRFTAHPGQAERVYLVIDSPTAPSRWIQMSPAEDESGQWSVTAEIDPGRTRLRYFTMDGGAYLNCGSVGLYGERADESQDAFPIPADNLAASA